MRNYISAFFLNWQVTIYDDTHTLAGQFFTSMAGDTRDDLMLNVRSDNDLIIAGLPANWTAEFAYPTDPVQAWFLFDKNTFMNLLKTIPDFFYADIQTTDPAIQTMRTTVEKSPRATGWTDQAGVKREPTPSDTAKKADFSGAQGLLDALAQLPLLAAQLTKEGQFRKAGIVLYAYNQVIKNTWSITEAFAYLREQRIL